MKEYYLYDSDFSNLGKTGILATFFFALGSGCLGFALNIYMGMAFSGPLQAEIAAKWSAYEQVAFIISAGSYVIAVVLTLSGYNTVEHLKSLTVHGADRYTPRPWYRVALIIVVLLAMIGLGYWLGTEVGR